MAIDTIERKQLGSQMEDRATMLDSWTKITRMLRISLFGNILSASPQLDKVQY